MGKGGENPAVRPTVKATAKAIRHIMKLDALYTVLCVLYTAYCMGTKLPYQKSIRCFIRRYTNQK